MSTLNNITTELDNIKTDIINCHTNLSSILTSKNIEVSEQDKMGDLIGKVDLLGEYDNPILYLYKDGDECVDVTGGYSKGYTYHNTGKINKNADNIEIVINDDVIFVSSNKKIDLSLYSSLFIDCEYTNTYSSGWYKFGFSPTVDQENDFIIETKTFSSLSRSVRKLDISNLTGSFYFRFGQWMSANSKIYKIWLEK